MFTSELLASPELVLNKGYTLCSRIIGSHSIIPPYFFTPHPSPNLGMFIQSTLKVLHFFASSMVPAWNSLPPSIFDCKCISSFKKKLTELFTFASVSLFWCSWSNSISSLPISYHPIFYFTWFYLGVVL